MKLISIAWEHPIYFTKKIDRIPLKTTDTQYSSHKYETII